MSLSGTLATTGCAVPYAVGAKFARPHRPVVALAGDGAMQMSGPAELITVAKYRLSWDDPRLVIGVWNNGDLNQVTWEMRAMGGSPQFVPSQWLPDVSCAAFARSLGMTGLRVEHPDEGEDAWRTALECEGPAMVEFLTDPTVPPLPPHTGRDQAEATAASLLRGDPERRAMVARGLRAKVQELLPRGRRPRGPPRPPGSRGP